MTSQYYMDSYKPQCFSQNKYRPTLPGQQLNKTFLTSMTWHNYISSYQFSVLLARRIHTNITRITVKQCISSVLPLAPRVGETSSMNRQPKMSTLEIPSPICKFLTYVHTRSPVPRVGHNTAKQDLLGWQALLPVVVIHRVVLVVSWRTR